MSKTYTRGDHLATTRLAYTHHGIYAGNGMVIEKSRKGVQMVTLEDFAEGYPVRVIRHPGRRYNRAETLRRAESRIGEPDYNVVFDNCEHFANWCIEGEERSDQVRTAAAASAAVVGKVMTNKVATTTTSTLIGVGASKVASTVAPSAVGKAISLGAGVASGMAAGTSGLAAGTAAVSMLAAAPLAPAVAIGGGVAAAVYAVGSIFDFWD